VNYSPSLFEDNASIRRREGLMAWEQEKEREKRRQQGLPVESQPEEEEDPFADFHDIRRVDVFDGEDGDIGRRKSGEGPFGAEEMMLDSESIHRGLILQKPMIASPWNENPFTYVDYGSPISETERDPMDPGRRRSISVQRSISPFGTSPSPNRRGSVVFAPEASVAAAAAAHASSRGSQEEGDRIRYLQPNLSGTGANASLGRAGPVPAGGGMRRGAITGQEGYVPPAPLTVIPPTPSPPQSRNGSSIELLEQHSRTKG